MTTPDSGTEPPRRTWRQWRIPATIGGRVRTSTVAFGICFALTAMLYAQVSAELKAQNEEAVQGPVAVDPNAPTPYTSPQNQTTPSATSSVSSTPTATGAAEQPTGVAGTGQQPSTTTPPTTTAPFGLPIPPAIQSLVPSQPAPTSSR
ncbi:hypothetical protein [Rhodococcus sp. MALMAid1271]|uniref:hypothetical protein n=1 Tax=Rhodococcus sp. MALMAid1271 TaxID=3411744 RepID=UPI003BA0CC1C